LIHLPQKRCLAYPLCPNDQDMISLSIKAAEFVDHFLPAEKCEAVIHEQRRRQSGSCRLDEVGSLFALTDLAWRP
jgi:hypothetical protein